MTKIPQSPASRAKSKGMAAQIERRQRIDAAKVQCDEWNQANPVGTNVVWRGEHAHTVDKARVGFNCEACVFIAVRIGAVALSDCEVVK